ncbi:serine protease inhibitor 77Ba isoform X2 [Cephus cinctus]|uniref:Serine protease inhibitor 77Ba isoform X2 n=1 Tax=Cephus cinctus TaxID=211228 RepID=A0AAJ7BXB2_CEPCN|nr:serine protease inhibitor 77Ba isoform X2 [Cephus cinctus]
MKFFESTCWTYLVALLLFSIKLPYAVGDKNIENDIGNSIKIVDEPSRILLSQGLENFTLNLFKETVNAAGSRLNLVLSPFSIWALLVLLWEGSKGKTNEQLMNVLGLPSDRRLTIAGYRAIDEALQVNTSTVSVEFVKAIFFDINRPLKRDFESTAEHLYQCPTISINFHKPVEATRVINDWVKLNTHGKIPDLLLEEDLRDAQLVLANAVYFQGQWSLPFDRDLTTRESFYDEDGKTIGEVDMMSSQGPYAFVADQELDANVIEIPYGKENRLSMIVMLPRHGNKNSIDVILEKLPQRNFSRLINDLAQSKSEYFGDDVDLRLPRFNVTSDFVMNVVLETMGLTDVFNENAADLSPISPHKIYLSRVIHKAVIVVDEEGTIATAASGAALANKSRPPKFHANRPFIYIIHDKKSNTIVFAGKVFNPN